MCHAFWMKSIHLFKITRFTVNWELATLNSCFKFQSPLSSKKVFSLLVLELEGFLRLCFSLWPLPLHSYLCPSPAQTRPLIIQSGARGELQLRCSETLPISQMTGVEEEQMVVPSRARHDCSLQLIKPLIFSILRAHVRKLLLPETLTRKCHKWLQISELTLMPTVTHLISFEAHHFLQKSTPSLAFAEGQANNILGMISHAGGHPSVKWLPLCPPSPPPFTSSMNLIVNRGWLLSDLVWWWYRVSAVPPTHLHFPSISWALTVSKCGHVE